MNTDRIFLGNIMCDKELFAANVVLLKTKNDCYVPLNRIVSFKEIYIIDHNISDLQIYDTIPNGYYYVDKNSLYPYYAKQRQKSLRKVKLDIIWDKQNSNGL